MAKRNEIDYIKIVSEVDKVPSAEFKNYLLKKPFSDPLCWQYLIDVGEIMKFLPNPPARILDIGAGSGWTSELYARSGYAVIGVDISPDMIELARLRISEELDLDFKCSDYEEEIRSHLGEFDAVIAYDALHHAEKEHNVIQNVFDCLYPNGIFITMEPGVGHSKTPESIQAMAKYGTTERDMDFEHQKRLMKESGFGTITQFYRISHLPLESVSSLSGIIVQWKHMSLLAHQTSTGYTSLVIAKKDVPEGKEENRNVQKYNITNEANELLIEIKNTLITSICKTRRSACSNDEEGIKTSSLSKDLERRLKQAEEGWKQLEDTFLVRVARKFGLIKTISFGTRSKQEES